ncbi:MAG: hypothetical protein HY349_08055 [Nitrospirae bacterium]|nr:hypothetical protein [Nitrospirota bacterium]
MLKACRTAVVPILLTLPVGIGLFVPAADADDLIFAAGVKEQFVTLRRTLKLEAQTTGETRRTETPPSDATWRHALVLSASYGRWFVGAEAATSSLTISEQPASYSTRLFFQKSKVDLDELNLALGYNIMTGVSPYIGYLQHGQKTDLKCTGCTTTVNLSDIGPGLLVNFPAAGSRWAAYVNLALIQGFSVEGGFSYAGIRMPLVAVAGFAYRRIDYPSEEISCGQTGFFCFRERDVISGPILAVHYVF